MVKTDLVDPLKDLGYNVAWNENVFPPGENTDGEVVPHVLLSPRLKHGLICLILAIKIEFTLLVFHIFQKCPKNIKIAYSKGSSIEYEF